MSDALNRTARLALAAGALALCLAAPLGAAVPDGTTVVVGTDGPDLRALRAAAGVQPGGSPVLGPSAGPWLVPFVVDAGNSVGLTTLLAVRNDAALGDAAVTVEFLDAALNEFHQVDLTLEPDQVQSFNLRDQPNLPPSGGLTYGLVQVTAGAGELISVDTFRVDPSEDFATGGLAIDLPEEECGNWKGRLLIGGPFTGGTRLTFFINGPRGADTASDPPTITGSVYNEAGTLQNTFSVWTNAWVLELDGDLLLNQDELFGSFELAIDGTQGGGHLTVEHSASGRYSVSADGFCLD